MYSNLAYLLSRVRKSIDAVKPFLQKACLSAVIITSVTGFACVPATAMNSENREDVLIQHKKDKLDVQIENKPLKQVMDELKRATGITVMFDDPAMAELPVSASAKAVSLRKAVKLILEGFSYAFYQGYRDAILIVLSDPPNSGIVGDLKYQTSTQSKKTFDVNQSVTSGHSRTDPAATPEHIPQTLEEFRSLRVAEDAAGLMDPDQDTPDPLQDPEYHEALLQRALDVLSSDHQHLRAEALDQLASLQDPRAADALIAAADDEPLRFSAIEALGRQAANQNYSDASSVSALQRFAKDNDPSVRSLAQQALEQMHRDQFADLGE